MNIFTKPHLFRLALQLIAVHSFAVGVGLIVLPFGTLSWLGFTVDPYRFFSTQGGVFHIVMSVAYILASRELMHSRSLVVFIIIAKWAAFLFLSLYFLFSEMVPVIALSAIGDGLMGLIVLFFYLELDRIENQRENS
ncbi:MAG: hypothetical protein K9N35_03270 [Candidatus Marinimicrobia bacterium]|nr:hypothetical protein [Candidatus Neomarinimicrobiota bacterium]